MSLKRNDINQFITAWKCPKCEIYNLLNEITKCQNAKEGLCSFDIQDGEADPDFCELTQVDYL